MCCLGTRCHEEKVSLRMKYLIEKLKLIVRLLEAAIAPRRGHFEWAGRAFRVVRSIWWDESWQDNFNEEIVPYFKTLQGRSDYRVVVDVGAAVGLFSMAAAIMYPNAIIHAFEPSLRQRVLLRRNLRLNRLVDRIIVSSFGLWKCEDVLAFRTNGAISSLQSMAQLPSSCLFLEKIPVIRLDRWAREAGLQSVDLIKMDIEGAEIEALLGAEETLRRHHPDLLVQAYHLRDESRTFERCAAFLVACGYVCSEVGANTGMLFATFRSADARGS